jgi:hypothetical protein
MSAEPKHHWLALPPVSGPSALDRKIEHKFAISPEFVERNASISRNTPILQLWAHVVGKLPPINNVSRLATASPTPTLCTLANAVGCFQGIKRPHDDEHDGDSVAIYVLNPLVTIAYHADMVCLAKAVTVPKNTVLTVQVRPKHPLLTAESQLNGVITRLEFVSSDASDPTMPVDHGTRYARMLWREMKL